MTLPQKYWTSTGGAARVSGDGGGQLARQTPMLTIPEVAATCRISQTSVRRAISEGELEAIKLRSRIRITREAFDAWLASQQRPATRPKPLRPSLPRTRVSRPKKAPRVFPPPGSFRELSRAGINQDAA